MALEGTWRNFLWGLSCPQSLLVSSLSHWWVFFENFLACFQLLASSFQEESLFWFLKSSLYLVQIVFYLNDISGYLNYHIGTMSIISVNKFYFFWLIFVTTSLASCTFASIFFRIPLLLVTLNYLGFLRHLSLPALYLSHVYMWPVLLKLSTVKDKLFFSFQSITDLHLYKM